MSIMLQPQETFAIVRKLQDPADATTYYVRAVVRNSRTDAVISTLNMVDKGSSRFTKEYLVPADPLGLGLFVDITTSVYTDSGYTVPSTTYGEENETYLIHDRRKIGGGGMGGFSPDIDYKRINKLVLEAVKNIEISTPSEVDLQPISEQIQALQQVMHLYSSNTPQQVDLTPVVEALASLKNEVSTVKATKSTPLDLTPFKDKLEEMTVTLLTELKNESFNITDKVNEILTSKEEEHNTQDIMTSFKEEFATSFPYIDKAARDEFLKKIEEKAATDTTTEDTPISDDNNNQPT